MNIIIKDYFYSFLLYITEGFIFFDIIIHCYLL
jgi:hypothetical protein